MPEIELFALRERIPYMGRVWRRDMRRPKLKMANVTYELFHCSREFFNFSQFGSCREIRRLYLEGCYQLVHTFRKPAKQLDHRLEEVFEESQNIETSWRGSNPCRSTSVGDIVRVGRDYWIVAAFGFVRGWRE
jgi:hypothetical protein